MIATPIISIRVKLSGSVTANQCSITGQFVTMTNLGIVSTVQPIHTTTNNTSAVVIVPNTLSGSISTLKNLQIYNADTVNATVTIEQFNNQDSSTRTVCTKTLIPSETLIIDADGNISTLLDSATISHSTLNNLTWASSGHTGNASSVASFAANGTAQYLTVNGTGSLVMTNNASLTNANLTTPILGTPQSGNLTNCTGNATSLTAGNVSNLNLSGNGTSITGNLNVTLGGTGVSSGLVLTRQRVRAATGNYTSTTAWIPNDNTKPLITEGAEVLNVAITPKSVNSTLVISGIAQIACNVANTNCTAALFASNANESISASQLVTSVSNITFPVPIPAAELTLNSTNTTYITMRIGNGGNQTTYLNGASGTQKLGGAMLSSITVEELEIVG